MKNLILALPFLLAGCLGDSSKDNETIGQVKKVEHNTPIMLPDYDDADISLGVMKNGVGSLSHEDMWVYVPNPEDFKILQQASQTGELVKIKYDVARARFYVEKHTVTHVEILK